MKRASAALIRDICLRWQIPIDRDHVVVHFRMTSYKPNCPAAKKDVIDELITLAIGQQANLTVEEGVKKIEEGLAIIKKFI